jgi:hypothetical protein
MRVRRGAFGHELRHRCVRGSRTHHKGLQNSYVCAFLGMELAMSRSIGIPNSHSGEIENLYSGHHAVTYQQANAVMSRCHEVH